MVFFRKRFRLASKPLTFGWHISKPVELLINFLCITGRSRNGSGHFTDNTRHCASSTKRTEKLPEPTPHGSKIVTVTRFVVSGPFHSDKKYYGRKQFGPNRTSEPAYLSSPHSASSSLSKLVSTVSEIFIFLPGTIHLPLRSSSRSTESPTGKELELNIKQKNLEG